MPADRNDLRVLAEAAYPDVTAGSRVRVVEMATHLAQLGVQVDFAPSMTNAEYELISSPGVTPSKVIAVARAFARSSRVPRPLAGLVLVHRLRSLLPALNEGAPLDVYDFDDALYVGSISPRDSRLGRFKREATRCLSYLRRARLVLAGNRVLAEEARRHARRVEIIPSCVNPGLQQLRRHREADVLTLGWIGSRTTSAYLRPVLEVVGSLHAGGYPVRLVLMGASISLRAPWIEHRTWSPEAERRLLTEIDIGLMPLPDDPWTRGKCGFKLLRYFSAGLPTIASPVGVNRELLTGGRGVSAGTAAEWSRGIVDLGRDAAARGQIGARARDFVEREYSYGVWAPRVAELLRGLA